MKRIPLIAIALFATASLASAEPANQFVDAGFVVGGDTLAGGVDGVQLGGGVRVHGPLWLRAAVIAGEPANFIDGEGEPYVGTYRAARVGVEHRLCNASGRACLASGLDLGVRRFDEMTTAASGAQTAVRVGLDTGGRVRFRTAVEGLVDLGRDHGTAVFDGVLLTMAVGFQP